MKAIRLFISVIACLLTLSTAHAAEKVMIGQPNWAYAKVLSNVIKTVAEENFGLELDIVPGNHPVFFKAMDQGRGQVDIHPDVWLPNNQSLVDEYVRRNGTVALTPPTFPAMDGFCTTKEAKEKYGLVSVYDLTKPEIVQLTDRNGDGRGEIWIGGPGWRSTKIHNIRARDYGFADLYDLGISEENVILSQIDSDIKAGRVVVWACYQPHHIFSMYDLVVLEEPKHDPAKWKLANLEDDPNWYENSSVATSFPEVTSQIAYSKRLETASPQLVDMLNRVKLSTQIINDWSFAVAVQERDPAEYAAEWIRNNQELVNSWLGK